MCGGRGKRLGKLTEKIPKPLVKVNDQIILNVKLEQYLKQGFKDFIFCIGYKGSLIKKTVSSLNANMNFEFSDSGLNVGILERLYYAKDLFNDQILMTYGDTFTDIKLKNLIETHNNSDNEVTIVTAPIMNPFGLVEFNEDNKVIYLKELFQLFLKMKK